MERVAAGAERMSANSRALTLKYRTRPVVGTSGDVDEPSADRALSGFGTSAPQTSRRPENGEISTTSGSLRDRNQLYFSFLFFSFLPLFFFFFYIRQVDRKRIERTRACRYVAIVRDTASSTIVSIIARAHKGLTFRLNRTSLLVSTDDVAT